MCPSGKDDSALLEAAQALTQEDIGELVAALTEKDDRIRYEALLLLQSRSAFSADVYPYWDTFLSKLEAALLTREVLGSCSLPGMQNGIRKTGWKL
jgi:hypothetical protein